MRSESIIGNKVTVWAIVDISLQRAATGYLRQGRCLTFSEIIRNSMKKGDIRIATFAQYGVKSNIGEKSAIFP